MRKFLSSLSSTDTPFWRYNLTTFLFSAIPPSLIAGAILIYSKFTKLNLAGLSVPESSFSFINLVGKGIIAPVIETLILALVIAILSSFLSNKLYIASIASILFGLGHAYFAFIWFFAPAWMFFILSYAYLTWREKGFKHAYFAALIPHVFNNVVILLLIISTRHLF
jgi:hypothetical protein